jgi:hypothetical protein
MVIKLINYYEFIDEERQKYDAVRFVQKVVYGQRWGKSA